MRRWSDADCVRAISAATSAGLAPALVGPPWHVDPARVCDVAALPRPVWEGLGFAPHELVALAVREMQVVRYQPGGRFDWHVDSVVGSGRRSTIIVQLSPGDEYEGGLVELMDDGGLVRLVPRTRGHVEVFPVGTHHRVLPVVSGVRWALVAWGAGG